MMSTGDLELQAAAAAGPLSHQVIREGWLLKRGIRFGLRGFWGLSGYSLFVGSACPSDRLFVVVEAASGGFLGDF